MNCRKYDQSSNANDGHQETKQEDCDTPQWWRSTQRLVSSEDTLAQWIMVFLSLASIIVSGVAVYLVWVSIGKTNDAIALAREANKISRESGKAQSRAYVSVEWAMVELNRLNSKISIKVVNSGHTPALWVNIHAEVIVFNADEQQPSMQFDRQAIGSDWGAIPSGNYAELPTYCQAETAAILKVQEARGILTLDIFGRIRYETIFGEVYETEFDFHINDMSVRARIHEHDADMAVVDLPCRMLSSPKRGASYKLLSGGSE